MTTQTREASSLIDPTPIDLATDRKTPGNTDSPAFGKMIFGQVFCTNLRCEPLPPEIS